MDSLLSTRIARLTLLQVLDLGMEVWFITFYGDNGDIRVANLGPPTFDTLELRLGAGLGILSTLSRLEVFGFEGINNKVGDRELAWMTWMVVDWPKLKTLNGLQKRMVSTNLTNTSRKEVRETMLALQPYVNIWP